MSMYLAQSESSEACGFVAQAGAESQEEGPGEVAPALYPPFKQISPPSVVPVASGLECQLGPTTCFGFVLHGMLKLHVSGPVLVPVPSWPNALCPQQ
jgi:hypothetical protein